MAWIYLCESQNGRLQERFPTGWNHPVDEKSLQIQNLEHILLDQIGICSKAARRRARERFRAKARVKSWIADFGLLMSDDLDANFGRCEAPVRFNPEEGSLAPRTLFTLNAQTAAYLSDLIGISRRSSHKFPCFPFADFTILWLVTEAGEIRIAVEEGVLDDDGNPSFFPLPTAARPEFTRFGRPTLSHTALVGSAPARIGGEILCDLGEDPVEWYISNRSGRYGVNLGRTFQQLANAAAEFAKYGVELKPDFY